MSNKKINASNVNIPSISLTQQLAHLTPISSKFQAYIYNNNLIIMRPDGTVKTWVDLDSTQTLQNKTLSSLVIEDTGGAGHFLQQNTLGGAVTSSALPLSGMFQGRLTLTSGTPITTSNVTGAGTVYLTPFMGNGISLYESGAWVPYEFSEISLALTLSAALPYDLFVYSSGGSLVLERVAWTNGTTRATNITLQNGVYVKSGETSKRYVGTLYSSGVNTTEDSTSKRFLWNYYNRVRRSLLVTDITNSWNYNSSTWRPANNLTANRVEFILGVAGDLLELQASVSVEGNTVATTGIGIDSTSANSANIFHDVYPAAASVRLTTRALHNSYPALGYHYAQWLEAVTLGTATYYGDAGTIAIQSGMMGYIAA